MIIIRDNDNPARMGALAITLLIHAGLFLILMWIMLTKPTPPMAGGEGMVVNLGYVDESTGEIQPMSENTMTDEVTPEMPQPEQPQPAAEKILTQDMEETEKVDVTEKNVEEVKKVEEVKEVVETKVEEKKIKTVDPKALYKGKSNNSTSQGISNKGSGDQGSPDGDPRSNYYGKSGTGNSPGGGGDGTGGISVDLKNRRPQLLPEPEYNIQESGSVVVEITVDRNGNVIHAMPGKKGSTTTNSYLLGKAKLAALSTKFDANQNAPEFQKGIIVYNFLLK